jgi:hypothetical protein
MQGQTKRFLDSYLDQKKKKQIHYLAFSLSKVIETGKTQICTNEKRIQAFLHQVQKCKNATKMLKCFVHCLSGSRIRGSQRQPDSSCKIAEASRRNELMFFQGPTRNQ